MENRPKSCFVVMGFGIKTDFATGRKLDLNKSYRLLIKPVVEARGLTCLRADEIQHSGVIDVPMYMELMRADVVIADLSTANANAFYELGIRHALRPRTTIVISEDKMAYPFDVNHINITNYAHLGTAIDFDEVERFRRVLGDKLDAVLNLDEPDSPVYTYLNLVPPCFQQVAIENSGEAIVQDDKEEIQTLSALAEQAEEALSNNRFEEACTLFSAAVKLSRLHGGNPKMSADAYLVQRLALSTYKAAKPDLVSALYSGLELLTELDLGHTNDPETVALAGAIEKRLYETNQGNNHLSAAILYYQRGYYLLNNRYNGINLAFMFDYRAQSSLSQHDDERIADLVNAKRIRREVLVMCDKDSALMEARRSKIMEAAVNHPTDRSLEINAENLQMFWILSNRAEANFGLGNMEAYNKALEDASLIDHEPWMMQSLQEQIEKLKRMQSRQRLTVK